MTNLPTRLVFHLRDCTQKTNVNIENIYFPNSGNQNVNQDSRNNDPNQVNLTVQSSKLTIVFFHFTQDGGKRQM